MNILHLSPNYVPINNELKHGGVERVLSNLIREQLEYTCINNIYLAGVEGSFIQNVEVNELYPTEIQLIRKENRKEYMEKMNDSVNDVLSLIENKNINILHDHYGFFSSSKKGSEYILKNKLKTIVTIYGLPQNIYYKNIYSQLASLSKEHREYIKICCVSKSHKALFNQFMNIDSYVYNGIEKKEKNKLDIRKKRQFFLSLATIQQEKGHLEHIKLAKKLKKKLIIVGKHDENIRQNKFINEFNSSVYEVKNSDLNINAILDILDKHSIIHIEEVNESLKVDLFNKSEALLYMVNWLDPLPVAILESLSFGIPVITSKVDSIKEISEHNEGIIFNETELLEQRMNSLDYSRIKLDDRFTSNFMAKKYLDIYKGV